MDEIRIQKSGAVGARRRAAEAGGETGDTSVHMGAIGGLVTIGRVGVLGDSGWKGEESGTATMKDSHCRRPLHGCAHWVSKPRIADLKEGDLMMRRV